MEYGLESSFKIYAGGLGILAGDYLKGAKDYDYPIVGIGIKWRQGYTDQLIGNDGKPYDTYRNYDYDFLEDTGIKVPVKIRQRDVMCKVWKVDKFGNNQLYLLDTDIPENEDTGITSNLYGGFGEDRVAQEMVLGIGGIRALRALGIDIDVYHFNEGHAVFAGFELIREKMYNGMSFEEAFEKTKKEIVFTTHTPVVEGNESHYLDRLMYMGANNGLTLEQMIKIGGSPFNMTVAGLRLSRVSNAVSKLHCDTANKMWKHVDERSDIIGITNGVHLPTWVDEKMIEAAEKGENIWETHCRNKNELIEFVREKTGVRLEPNKLLIGFARRAAPYKRGDFIFKNKEIITPLLEERKIQIIFSGKAHPLDDVGKTIVQNIVKMSKKYPKSVVFLENYDMNIGKMLTRGCDVWLNNPRRPKEASGTSGMKAAMNGVLNLSILDGWWPEACEHGVNGWQFGDGFQTKNVEKQDSHDLKALYNVLLNEVIPTYYENREKWVEMMKNSILSTKDMFSIKRMLEEYYEKMYID
ncbi:alpha-glucan phosphorylase [Thermohalobacter berrensis]|uniref:glycogen phosphorylase n=2 Tax=Thermohalobacter berrensis TaxID=99594 RepID=A0A419T1K0_9FIRM|nr:alpha-glucan phosphorylase [Thermohalobacter berrensis]